MKSTALTFAVGALALAIFTTGTAVATSGQLVHITDPATGTGAQVYGAGSLRVGDGSGPISVDGTVGVRGPVAVGDGAGPLTVDGELGTQQTVWTSYLSAYVAPGASGDCSEILNHQGAPVQLNSIVVNAFGPATPTVTIMGHLNNPNGSWDVNLFKIGFASVGGSDYVGHVINPNVIYTNMQDNTAGRLTRLTMCVKGHSSGEVRAAAAITGTRVRG